MTPTMEFRYVIRDVSDEASKAAFWGHPIDLSWIRVSQLTWKAKILQQKFIDPSIILTSMPPKPKTVWVDVPTEEE